MLASNSYSYSNSLHSIYNTLPRRRRRTYTRCFSCSPINPREIYVHSYYTRVYVHFHFLLLLQTTYYTYIYTYFIQPSRFNLSCLLPSLSQSRSIFSFSALRKGPSFTSRNPTASILHFQNYIVFLFENYRLLLIQTAVGKCLQFLSEK